MTSKFHDLLAFKCHKTIKFNDYHKGVFHPEKCFYLSDIILIKLHYLISTSKWKIHLQISMVLINSLYKETGNVPCRKLPESMSYINLIFSIHSLCVPLLMAADFIWVLGGTCCSVLFISLSTLV